MSDLDLNSCTVDYPYCVDGLVAIQECVSGPVMSGNGSGSKLGISVQLVYTTLHISIFIVQTTNEL